MPGFLEGLRRITQQYGALLIFDEVMTGFRLARGGAQQLFNITPDLTTLGKIIGGGLPIAAYGGRAEIMNKVAPSGPVYQAGTLSGNPLAVSAGIAMLRQIEEHPEIYDILEQRTAALTADPPAGTIVNRVGSMATFFFQSGPVRNATTRGAPTPRQFGKFFHHLLERDVYLPPSQYEALFVSAGHSPADIDHTVQAIREFPAATSREFSITGSAKRIGRTIAIELSRRGFHVAIHYNRSPFGGRRSF